jgi:hypothetical protein
MEVNIMNETAGNWLGWLGIIAGIVGFFVIHYWLGILAIILGIIGLFTPKKGLNWVAIAAGVIAVIIGIAA